MDCHIIYLSQILDVPINRLYMLSNHASSQQKHRKKDYYRNYHRVILKHEKAKKVRVLNVPNPYLKTVQRRILNRILYQLPVSDYAYAYVQGKCLLDNALPHIGKDVIIKLDISQFFDHISGDMVYGVFHRMDFSEPATVLLTNLCVYQNKLPQGAPTSPYLANLVMKKFDEEVGKWCEERDISYTRYCDDMTFSGSKDTLQNADVIPFIRKKLYYLGLSLNTDKTAVVSSAQQQRVTSVIVNQKANVQRELRRQIRKEVFFCRKHGVKDHLLHRNSEAEPTAYLRQLLGQISYVMQIDPNNTEIASYYSDTMTWLREMQSS